MEFVYEDVAQPPQEPLPPLRSGQERIVQKIRVGEDDVGPFASPVALGRGRIAVDDAHLDVADLPGPQHLLELRSEEHTSELQSRFDLVCRLLLEKKK